MKRFFITACMTLIVACGLLVTAAPAQAFETPVSDEKGKAILAKMGGDLLPVAGRLGAPHFVWGDFIEGGRVAALVYTPVEKNFKASPRKVSIAVYVMPGKPAEDLKIMTAAAKGLVEGYKKNGKVIRQDLFHNDKQEPGLFIEYTIGEGDKKEHNAGIFVRLTPYTAAFIQLQSRGKPLSAEESAKVKGMIAGGNNAAKAKAPAADKKG